MSARGYLLTLKKVECDSRRQSHGSGKSWTGSASVTGEETACIDMPGERTSEAEGRFVITKGVKVEGKKKNEKGRKKR